MQAVRPEDHFGPQLDGPEHPTVGAVWHASVAAHGGADPSYREVILRRALDGVGDASRGEWIDANPRAVHIRRRLSESEDRIVGPVKDVRGNPIEVERRWARVQLHYPHYAIPKH